MTEPPSGVRSRTLLEFLAYPLRVGVSQFLEDAERPLPRGRRSTSTGTGRGVCVAEADQGIGHVQAVTHLLEDSDRSQGASASSYRPSMASDQPTELSASASPIAKFVARNNRAAASASSSSSLWRPCRPYSHPRLLCEWAWPR